MEKYCAFLRGVNVSGTSMKMTEVIEVFAEAGMQKVTTVLATGNILFSSNKNQSELKRILEKAMSDYFNYEAFIFLKTENEIAKILKNNPFQKLEDCHIYVFIGGENIDQLLLEQFNQSTKSESEKGAIINQIFYWQVEKGNTLASTFGKVLGKKSLKEKMTFRNLNTMEKIQNKF